MTGDNLVDLAKSVATRADFVKFVDHLREDHRRGQWENHDLGDFLSGLAGFAHGIGGYYRNMGEDVDVEVVTWRMAAQMLLAATVYE